MKIFNRIQYIILYVLSFFIIGVTSVISGELKWGSFKDAIFYIQNLLTYAAIVCVIVGTLLYIIDKFKQTNGEFVDSEKKLQEFAAKTYVPSVFANYCSYINRKRKINQFLYNTKKKLFKLERKAKEQDLYLWNNDRANAIKHGNLYCLTRKRLEDQLNLDWIEKNIDKIEVRYDKITANVILGGEFSKSDNFAVNDYITKHKAGKVARDKAPMILLSFGITCFASSIIVGFRFDASALILFLTKLIVLCFNTFMTIRYANNYTNTVTLKDIRFRKGIVKEYSMWITQQDVSKDKEADTSEADKIYNEAKEKAAAEPEGPKGIMKLVDASPVGAVIDLVKEVKEHGRQGTDDVKESDAGNPTV